MLSTNIYSFLLNQIRICINRKSDFIDIRYNKRIPKLLNLFMQVGWVTHYMFIYKKIKNKRRFLIRVSPLYFKNKSFYRHAKLVTTPSREYSLNMQAMNTLKSYSGQTVFILSTSKGIMTMEKAFELNIGGIILYYLI